MKTDAMCGFCCERCQAYAPNIEKQDQREVLSALWKACYGLKVPADRILCDGCRCTQADARRADEHCPVRRCVTEHRADCCGECPDYPCAIFRERCGLGMSAAREKLGTAFDPAAYATFLAAYNNRPRMDRIHWRKTAPRLTTPRLLLRAWEDGDAAELYRYARDPRIGTAAGFPPHENVENSLAVLRSVLSDPETYAVVLRETGLPVGSAGIMFPSCGSTKMAEGEAEIGYWIGVPYWGRGLIPEAVRLLLRRCFLVFGCRAVWCGYFDGNDKSRRVQEKCGLVYDHTETDKPTLLGETRTEHFTRITREQWLSGQADAE